MNTEDIKNLLTEENAVSPVIGVILMVAITVILAAVIGTFVLGLGDQVSSSAPQASFSFEYTEEPSADDTLEITHDGGDTVPASELNASVSGAQRGGSAVSHTGTTFGSTGDVSAGSSDTLEDADFGGGATSNNLDLSSATVRVVWSSSGGDSTQTLAKWEGPDA